MKEIIIEALTDNGKLALKQHMEESLKLKALHKAQFRLAGYTQEVLKEEPYTISIRCTNVILMKALKIENFLIIIDEAMTKNGARLGEDYIVMEEKK